MKRLVMASLVFFLLRVSSAEAQTPFDLIYHALPTVPTFDIPEEVAQVTGNLQSSFNQAKQIVLQAKSDVTSLQSAVTATFENIKNGTFIDINGASGQGKETFCGKPLKDVKVKKIAKKMRQVFLTYRSYKGDDVLAKEEQREQFYIENVYAIYVAAIELQNKLNGDIKTKISTARSCAEGDGAACGYPSTDEGGNNEVLFAYGKALETLDSVVRLWENVTALKARLKAVEAMQGLTPMVETEADKTDNDETAFLHHNNTPLSAVAMLHNSSPLAFAQVGYKGVTPSLANIEAGISGSRSEATQLIGQAVAGSAEMELKTVPRRAKFVSQEETTARSAAVRSEAVSAVKAEAPAAAASQAATSARATRAEISKAETADRVKSVAVDERASAVKADVAAVSQEETTARSAAVRSEAVSAVKAEAPAAMVSQAAISARATRAETAKVSMSRAETLRAKTADEAERVSIVRMGVEFASPKEADNEHPLVDAEEQMEELSNLTPVEVKVNEAMSVHNMLKQLKEYRKVAEQVVTARKDHQRSLEKLQKAEQCAINFMGHYFSDPVKPWSDVSLEKYVNNHEVRGGISRWAVDAYETAKAAETSTISTDDVAQMSFDADTQADLQDDPDMKKAEKLSQNTTISVNTSKQEASAEESRRSAILPWQIGAEAVKLLWADAGDWGRPTNVEVWEDAKTFYNQYLRRKYDNIRSYLKSFTRDDVLALIISRLRGQETDISETKYQQQLKKSRAEAASQMVSTTNSRVQYNAASRKKLESLQQQRETLVSRLDKANDNVNEKRNTIADIRSVAEDSATQAIDGIVNAEVVFPAVGQTTVSEVKIEDKIIGADNLTAAVSAKTKNNTDEEKIASLEEEAKTGEIERDRLKEDLEALDNSIAEAIHEAQETAAVERMQGSQTLSAIQTQLTAAVQENASQYAEDVRKNLEDVLEPLVDEESALTLPILVAQAVRAADSSLQAFYTQVDSIIELHYNQLMNMRDLLYRPAGHERVVQIHQQMIDELKALTLVYNVAGLIEINDIALYAKLLSMDTSAETEGFFVGAAPKERDLKAPYAIPNFSLPPVREVFHFDVDDYANIKPYVKGKEDDRAVTAEEFLNYGGDIPLIWQYMLKDNAFIESQFDLKEALTSSCGAYVFRRGGFMPCVVDGSDIIIDVNDGGEFIRRGDEKVSLSAVPTCYLMYMKNGKPYHRLVDAEIDIKMTTRDSSERDKILNNPLPLDDYLAFVPPESNCQGSELGIFLRAGENNTLYFNDPVADAYNLLQRDDDTEDMTRKEKNRLAGAKYAEFSRNQIGDFLKFVENEKVQRENMEEYEQKYEAQLEEVKQQLEAYGFAPSESFDLINDEDYELAAEKLNEIKSGVSSEVKISLAQVDQSDNAPVQEKVGNFEKLISVMQQDKNAVMSVSITTADNNNIDADLKKAEADAELVDKYKNSLNDQADDYTDIEEPYCANYW